MLFRNKTYIKWVLCIIFIIILIGVSFGMYFLNPTSQIVEVKTDRLVIEEMFIYPEYWQEVNISGDYYVEQNYSIKSELIPWTKIRPNITVRDSSNNPTNANAKYNFASGYLLINNSRFNKTYVTLYGRKTENTVPKFYTLEIEDLNDTIQRWDIEFNNTYSYPIEIYTVNVNPREGLKYIKYDRSALSLNEVVMENGRIIIKRVEIYPDIAKIYSNRSITLYFEKYSK